MHYMRIDEATAFTANQHEAFHSWKVCKLRKCEFSNHEGIRDLLVLFCKEGKSVKHFSVSMDRKRSHYNSEHAEILKSLDVHIALH